MVGDEDVARALLAACKGAPEPVLNTYDKLRSSGAILPSPTLRLRLLRSVLVVLREWLMSVFAQRMGTSSFGASLILGGSFSVEQTANISQGTRDKIASLANKSVPCRHIFTTILQCILLHFLNLINFVSFLCKLFFCCLFCFETSTQVHDRSQAAAASTVPN